MIATLLLLSTALAAAPDQDPGLRRAARSAARVYESLQYRRAPLGDAAPAAGRCDEVIGRFCFRFGGDDPPPPEPEDPAVVAARRRAIAAHRRWLSADPASGEAAGALVRYLIEDGRASEAVSVARTHVGAAPGVESRLFLGLALHQDGDVPGAEAEFERARAQASPAERAALDDVSVLLSSGERAWYADLPAEARTAYHERFWAFSDPARTRPGNERRSAHYARHAWIRILARAPRVSAEPSWGDDRAEIVLRYGLPVRRERARPPPFRVGFESSVVSYYDPRAVPLVPMALHTAGIPSMPDPGVRSPLERDTVRSAYAPPGARRVTAITGQLSRLPAVAGWRLRVDAVLPADTVVPRGPKAPRAALVVLDTAGREVVRTRARTAVRSDSSTVIRAETALPPGRWVYQVELDDSTGVRGLARASVALDDGRLRLSDPVLAEPDSGALAPFPDLVLTPGPVRVHAEVAGLDRRAGTARYALEWSLESREETPALVRAARWVGRALGLVGRESPVSVGWEDAWEGPDPALVEFVLELGDAEPGPYRLRLTVRDRISGREATSYRALVLESPGA